MSATAMLPEQLQEFLQQGCGGAEMAPLCSETVPGFQLGLEIERLVTDRWSESCIALDVLEAQGASDIKVSPLPHGENQTPQSTALCVTARMPTAKLPGCAASAHVTFVFRVCTKEEDSSVSVTIESAAKADVPFGNYFVVQERITLQPVIDGVLVKKGFRVVFREALRIQKVIVASATAAQNKATALLLGILSRHATSLGDERVPTQIFEVWEMRQHSPLSRSGSCLPFLHSRAGLEQQCWLDMDHGCCALEGQRSPVLHSGVPPVRPPDGWRCKRESWAVAKPPGPADIEGWQYAFGKYKSDTMWGCTSIGRRWQRRLWRCTLVEVEVRKNARAVTASDSAAAAFPALGLVPAARQWRPSSCKLVAFAVALAFVVFATLGATNLHQHAALLLEESSHVANLTWASALGAAESAGAYVFPLSAFALFCIYPPVLLATMVLEGRAAQAVHTTKPPAAKELTAETMDKLDGK